MRNLKKKFKKKKDRDPNRGSQNHQKDLKSLKMKKEILFWIPLTLIMQIISEIQAELLKKFWITYQSELKIRNSCQERIFHQSQNYIQKWNRKFQKILHKVMPNNLQLDNHLTLKRKVVWSNLTSIIKWVILKIDQLLQVWRKELKWKNQEDLKKLLNSSKNRYLVIDQKKNKVLYQEIMKISSQTISLKTLFNKKVL